MYWGRERYIQDFCEKTQEKEPLGRPRRRWEDNTKMDLQEFGRGLIWLKIGTGDRLL